MYNYVSGGELPLRGDWRKTKEPNFNMVDVCVYWLVEIAAGFHSGVIASGVGWAHASAGCGPVRWLLAPPEACQCGDALPARPLVRVVDRAQI